MAMPFRRISKTRKRKRRTGKNKISLPTLTACTNCGSNVKPHHVCKNCGYYKEKEVISVDDE